MKPYDQVFIYDTYNDMYGPVEVEQVVHIFSSETGFVTVITPDLAEGDLSPERPHKSRLTPISGPFSVNFSFYNLPSSLSFFGKNAGFWGPNKEKLNIFLPISPKIFLLSPLPDQVPTQKYPTPKAPQAKSSPWPPASSAGEG
jgi:hypothetical protein